MGFCGPPFVDTSSSLSTCKSAYKINILIYYYTKHVEKNQICTSYNIIYLTLHCWTFYCTIFARHIWSSVSIPSSLFLVPCTRPDKHKRLSPLSVSTSCTREHLKVTTGMRYFLFSHVHVLICFYCSQQAVFRAHLFLFDLTSNDLIHRVSDKPLQL